MNQNIYGHGIIGSPFSSLENLVKQQCIEAVNSPEQLEEVVDHLEDILATDDE
jgi:hypothetical protein